MAKLKGEIRRNPYVRLSRFSAPPSTRADVSVLSEDRIRLTDEAEDFRTEHRRTLWHQARCPMALHPLGRRWFSCPRDDGAYQAHIDRKPVTQISQALHAQQAAVVSQSSISSNNRESCRATATVNNMRASGSIAQSSKPATFAETPTWAHWRHTNSSYPCRALSLSSEISIFDTQSAKSFPEHHAVTRRWILSQRPACRRGKFRRARMKSPEIRLVATVRLINHGEELEVDLATRPAKCTVSADCRPPLPRP